MRRLPACAQGWIDILIGNFGDTQLHRNLGDGTFERITGNSIDATWTNPDAMGGLPGKNTYSVCWLDYDNDGDIDALVSKLTKGNEMHRNDNGVFVAVSAGSLTASNREFVKHFGCADLNGDGLVDVVVATLDGSNQLHFNHPGGDFTLSTTTSVSQGSGKSNDLALGDYDGDG